MLFTFLHWKKTAYIYDKSFEAGRAAHESSVIGFPKMGVEIIGEPEKLGFYSDWNKNEYLDFSIPLFDELIESRVRIV